MTSTNNSQILLYQAGDGKTKIEVKLENETVWLTKKQMAELFNVKKQDIDYHVRNVFETGELEKSSTTKNILVVQKEGGRMIRRNIDIFNLDMIISVGYRVNSYRTESNAPDHPLSRYEAESRSGYLA